MKINQKTPENVEKKNKNIVHQDSTIVRKAKDEDVKALQLFLTPTNEKKDHTGNLKTNSPAAHTKKDKLVQNTKSNENNSIHLNILLANKTKKSPLDKNEQDTTKSKVRKNHDYNGNNVGKDFRKMANFNMILPGISPQIEGVKQIKTQNIKSTIPDKIHEVATQILVNNPEFSQREEVRIYLKDSFLPETEIRIQKKSEGIAVEFITKSVDSYRILSPHTNSLKTLLENKLETQVSMHLHFDDGEQHREGRSKQRRFVWEEFNGK